MVNRVVAGESEDHPLGLTNHESEVVRRAREGATDKEIAEALKITVASLRTCWNTVRDKLGAVNRTHAIALAVIDQPHEVSSNLRSRLIGSLSANRVATWVVRPRARKAYLDEFGAHLFSLPSSADGIGLERVLAHVWTPDRARFERFLSQGADLRSLTPIELRVGIPGEYGNLIRTANLTADGGAEPAVLLVSTLVHVFRT